MYASKIKINREPQKVPCIHKIELPDGWLTLDILKKYLNPNDQFSINEEDSGNFFGTTTVLTIKGERLETDEEVAKRVAKEEKYMDNYYKFHEKYGNK